MKRLTAHYEVRLDECLMIKRRKGDSATFTTTIDEFEISISIPDQLVAGFKSRAERLMTGAYAVVKVSVSRDDSETPPTPRRTDQGGIDYTVQSTYFGSRTEPYARVTAEFLNRFVLFVRYRLRQPLLKEFTHRHQDLQNPLWVDETGADAGHGPITWVGEGLPIKFGVIPLQTKHRQRLIGALGRRLVPRLYEELLADAQAAALRGNIRRAVLELAIACEVAVKRKFFGSSAGGRTIEYLEDKRHFQLPVVEMIGRGAEDVFGENFKSARGELHAANIDNLFQCRNKVAHRGRLIFRPQNMPMQEVTSEILGQWFSSARVLFAWLKKLRHG